MRRSRSGSLVRSRKITRICVAIGFDEPAGLEQRLVGPEHTKQQAESHEVEDRTDGSEHEHELAHEVEVPAARRATMASLTSSIGIVVSEKS